jgi:hypothetical protein
MASADAPGGVVVVFALDLGAGQAAVMVKSGDAFAAVLDALLRGGAQRAAAAAPVRVEQLKVVVRGKARAGAESVAAMLTEAERAQEAGEVVLKGRVSAPPAALAALVARWPARAPAAASAGPAAAGAAVAAAPGAAPAASVAVAAAREPAKPLPPGAVRMRVQLGREELEVAAFPEQSVLELKRALQSLTGVPTRQQKLLLKGSQRGDSESLEACGLHDGQKAMLLFHEGYHRAADGDEYLAAARDELVRAKGMAERSEKQASHRVLAAADHLVLLDCVVDCLDNYLHGLDGRPVSAAMAQTKDEVVADLAATAQRLRALKHSRREER